MADPSFTMSRRTLCRCLAGAGLAAWAAVPGHLFASDRPIRIVVLETMTLPGIQSRTEALRKRLATFGYREGENLQMLVLNAEKDRERGARMLRAAITQDRTDLVVSVATVASQAARDVLGDTTIPQVFFFVSDPVGAGLIRSVEGPSGSNITGAIQNFPRSFYVETMMRLLQPTAPRLPLRIGLLHSSYPASLGTAREVMETVRGRDDIVVVPILIEQKPLPDGIPDMVAAAEDAVGLVADRVDYLWLGEGPIARQKDLAFKLVKRLPKPFAMGTSMTAARAGVLAALDSDPAAAGHAAAVLCRAILNGTDPATIPVIRNQVFQVGLNLTTAEKLGVTPPQDLVEMAGENLFR